MVKEVKAVKSYVLKTGAIYVTATTKERKHLPVGAEVVDASDEDMAFMRAQGMLETRLTEVE